MTTAPHMLPQAQAIATPLRRSFGWTFSGNGLYALCQWGLLIEVARLGTSAMLGQLALAFAITAPIFMLTNLQLSSVIASDCSHQFGFSTYLTARLTGTVLALTCVALLLISLRLSRTTSLVIIAITVAKGAESVSDLFYGLWQKYEHFDNLAFSLGLRGIGSLVVCGIALAVSHSISVMAGSLGGYWLFCLLTYDLARMETIMHRHRATESWSGDRRLFSLKALLGLSWPCGMITLLLAVSANIPRYFIRYDLGDSALGIFAAVAYLPLAGGIVASSLGQSSLPRMSHYFRSDSRAFKLLLRKTGLISFGLGICGVLLATSVGSKLLQLIYSVRYGEYSSVFVWLMFAAALSFTSSVFGYSLTAARKFRPQITLLTGVTILTALICWVAIPRLGLTGAALAIVMGNLTTSIGTLFILKRTLMHNAEAA